MRNTTSSSTASGRNSRTAPVVRSVSTRSTQWRQVAARAESAHRHVGVWALAVPGTGACLGFSTVTDQGTDASGAIGVGPDRAVAVTTWLVWPAGSVKFTSTGKGSATAGTEDVLRTTPETEVRTIGGRLARKELVGTDSSTCCAMRSTVATTPPAGHTAWVVGGPPAGAALVGDWATDGAVGEPAGTGAADGACGAPGRVDTVVPAPSAVWFELLTGRPGRGTRTSPLSPRATITMAAAAAAPTGAASQRRAIRVRAGSRATTSGCDAGCGAGVSSDAGVASTRPMAAMTSAGGTSSPTGTKFLMNQPVGSRS